MLNSRGERKSTAFAELKNSGEKVPLQKAQKRQLKNTFWFRKAEGERAPPASDIDIKTTKLAGLAKMREKIEQGISRPATVLEGNIDQVAAAAVSALAKKSISNTFKEAAELFGGVARNMPSGEFRNELFKLVQKFDRKPSGAG